MAHVLEVLSIEHNIWSDTFKDASNHYNNKIAYLEKAIKFGKDSLAELCQKHPDSNNLIRILGAQITTLMGKHRNAQTKNEHLEEEVNYLNDEKSILKEKLRTKEEVHRAELENLRLSHKETFKKYQEETRKNMNDFLPEWRSNLI
ncbi:hypothetical protein PVK06_005092 [Gossypium arboreum]|uniref:Uncharacterized protein n=1 Tax=Gossypium arboreum TaxID=29729 RepID=A0ABR0QUZ0_GOSAR|nr:hypothetical protein PVK06_005092 [Gossypium arboreum]